MDFLNDLPTDSVLRRHALTERNRILGLPPSDSVLRRHYEQLQTAREMGVTDAPARTQAAARADAPSPSGGGLLGWLRRLLGA